MAHKKSSPWLNRMSVFADHTVNSSFNDCEAVFSFHHERMLFLHYCETWHYCLLQTPQVKHRFGINERGGNLASVNIRQELFNVYKTTPQHTQIRKIASRIDQSKPSSCLIQHIQGLAMTKELQQEARFL